MNYRRAGVHEPDLGTDTASTIPHDAGPSRDPAPRQKGIAARALLTPRTVDAIYAGGPGAVAGRAAEEQVGNEPRTRSYAISSSVDSWVGAPIKSGQLPGLTPCL
jgi:hypothetical protein